MPRSASDLRVALDVDGVLARFDQGIIETAQRMGIGHEFPRHEAEVENWNISPSFAKVWDVVKDMETFWRTLQPYWGTVEDANIIHPVAYVTHRPVPADVTMKWLDEHGYPKAPVFAVKEGTSKVPSLALIGADVFVDDNPDNVDDVLTHIPCYLMTRPHNVDWAPHLAPYRIESLLQVGQFA